MKQKVTMRTEGPSTKRWKGWRKSQRAIAVERATVGDYQYCEFAGYREGPSSNLKWHHIFGRVHIIAEPWASYHPLTVMVCLTHHMDAHEDTKTRRAMEWIAVKRFADEVNWIDRFWEQEGDWSPVEVIKTMVRTLDELGQKPNGF